MPLSDRRRFNQWCRRTLGEVMPQLYPAWQRDSEALKTKYREREDSHRPFGWSLAQWANFRKEFNRMGINITHQDGPEILVPEIKRRLK